MFIEPHMHVARNIVTHSELGAKYGIRDNMQLSLRLPYDIKDLRIRYETLDGAPFSPPYGDIHHRTQKLTGLGDAEVGVDWLFASDWIASTGLTLPVGNIVPNPIVLGRQGREHQHMQFGTGTFVPTIALQYSRPSRITWSARAETRVSLYENREGFRAPTTFLWSGGPSLGAGAVSIQASFQGQHQTIGRWNGEVDEGTGFTNGGVRLSVVVPVGVMTITPGVYRELFSEGLHHDETFRQGTTWSLSLSRTY